MTAILDAMRFQYLGAELRLYSGDDSLAALPRELLRAAANRAVVVSGPTVATTNAMVALREVLGARLAGVCTAVKAGSPVSSVLEVARTLKDLGQMRSSQLGEAPLRSLREPQALFWPKDSHQRPYAPAGCPLENLRAPS
jgi:hypothetical protein